MARDFSCSKLNILYDADFVKFAPTTESTLMTISKIAYAYKYSIGLVLSFVLLENIAYIIEPGFFGKLLDAMIDYFYDHEKVNYLTPLFIWIFIFILHVVGGTLSRFLAVWTVTLHHPSSPCHVPRRNLLQACR